MNRCTKCQGLMCLERFSDFFLAFYAWRCINCGALIDSTIALNRLNSRAGITFDKRSFLKAERKRKVVNA